MITPSDGIIEQSNIYFEGIGSFFYDGRELDVWRRRGDKYGRDPKHPFSILAALESEPYRVRGKKEVVEGVGCWVLEVPGRDRIWLDPGHGFAVVKREWLWDDGKTPMFRWLNSDFKEVVPGLWWPMRARRDVVTHVDRNTSGGGQVTVTNNVRVLTVLVNNVPDTVFSLTFPLGTRVLDDTRARGKDGQRLIVSYAVGGTPETTEIALRSATASRLASDRKSSWGLTVIWINAAVLLVIGAVFVTRRLCRRGASPSPVDGPSREQSG